MKKSEYDVSIKIWDIAKDNHTFIGEIITDKTDKIIKLLQNAIDHMKQKERGEKL